MKNPTQKDIESILHSYGGVVKNEQCAKAIHALYNPVMKPLSELANDDEACRTIASIYWPNFFEDCEIFRHANTSETVTRVHKDYLHIYDNGEMEIEIEAVPCPIHAFALVDKIRSLGYQPTQTK